MLRRLRKLCDDKDVVPKHYTKEIRDEILDEFVTSVNQCLNKRKYLTVCKLGAGGSEADIDVAILSALMKGMQTVFGLAYW